MENNDRVMLLPEFVEKTVELAEKIGLAPFDNDGNIHTRHILALCKGYVEGFIDSEALEEAFGCLTIREYIPLYEKSCIAMEVVSSLIGYAVTDGVPEFYIGAIEKEKFFSIILGQYACVCRDTDLETYENFDIIYQVIGRKLLKYCGDDYKIICDMIAQCVNIYNLKDLIDSLNEINVEKLKESTDKNAELVQKLTGDKDTVSALRDILLANDPGLAEVRRLIDETAASEAKKAGGVEDKIIAVRRKRGRPKKNS